MLCSITFCVTVQSQIQDMTKLSRCQGFRLPGINHEELLAVRVLDIALVQVHVDLVQALVTLFQALVPLVKADSSQGGLIWLERRQVVVGPGSGWVGSVR